MKSVVIAHQTITDGDAIGHDILGMYNILKGMGVQPYIFADYYSGAMEKFRIDRKAIRDILNRPDNILIYHHSVYWENGESILSACKGRIIIKYHNITPPDFFEPYSTLHYNRTLMGIEQTKNFLRKFPRCTWWGDSEYNCTSLGEYSGSKYENAVVVPPFHVLDDLCNLEPNFEIVDMLISNGKNNVLFVGRVAPNKGHKHLIEVIKKYRDCFGDNVHLWIVGSIDRDNLAPYNDMLHELIRKYDLVNNVTLTDKIPIRDIKAYYLGCDEMLCLSEHEGFCMPILESQAMLLPIVTIGDCALQETAGKDQIILDSNNYDMAAAALYTIYTDDNVKRFCKMKGLENMIGRFSNETIKERFVARFKEASGRAFK